VDGVTTHTLTAGAATRFAQSPEQRDRLRRELPTLVRFGQMINAVDTEGVASAWTPIEPTHRLRVRPDRTPGASSSRRACSSVRRCAEVLVPGDPLESLDDPLREPRGE
jgi:Asp-tRNA(Asn)/Glu-tRNA(Gln) amidotransferase C subunit